MAFLTAILRCADPWEKKAVLAREFNISRETLYANFRAWPLVPPDSTTRKTG